MNIESTSQMSATPAAKQDAKLKKACQDFESVLIQQMLTAMRQTVSKSDLFGDREKEDMFQGMLDQETSIQLSKSGSLKVAELLYKQLSIAEKPNTDKAPHGTLDTKIR